MRRVMVPGAAMRQTTQLLGHASIEVARHHAADLQSTSIKQIGFEIPDLRMHWRVFRQLRNQVNHVKRMLDLPRLSERVGTRHYMLYVGSRAQ